MANPVVTNLPVSSSFEAPQSSNHRAMAMVTTLFFIWGFLTSLNDILVPHLRAIFHLNYVQAMLVQFSFFSSYFVFAIPSGKIVEWIGYKRTMVAALLTMAAGALLFIPAASVPSFPLFLGALIVLAAGITALQVAANPYVTVLGPARTASSRLNLTQAFNSLGTTIAPYFGSLVILSAAPLSLAAMHKLSAPALLAYQQQEASSVKLPYIGIAITIVLLAVAIGMFQLPKLEVTREFRPMGELEDASVWKHRQLLLGALGIFLYVGAEVSIGSFLVNYFSLPEIGNMTEKLAATYVSLYWGGAMIGRFIGSAVLQRLRTSVVLGFAAVVAFLLVATSMATMGHVAMWAILCVGLFNSIMFPSIFTLGIEGLGPLTGKGSGLMVMAIVGGAVIPVIEGALADHVGIHKAFILPALCYIYIAYYGFRGSGKAKTSSEANARRIAAH
ncbi:MAG: sugar MFS transporter [Acidobacteriaceae bacterium]